MRDLSLRYTEQMLVYVRSEDEAALAAIVAIGCEIVASDLPIEEIAGLQEEAVLAVSRLHWTESPDVVVRRSSVCLAELLIGYSVAYRDRAELVARERRRIAQHDRRLAALGQLVGGVAHELNNLLQPIRGMAELGLLDVPPSGTLHTYFAAVLSSAEQAACIVRGILGYLRQEAPQLRPIGIGHALERSVEFARMGIVPGLRLRLEVAERDAVVIGDESELTQIIVNLVQNAARAMHGKGDIVIRVERTPARSSMAGEGVLITVRDDGPGMDATVAAQAFDPFFTTRPPGEGTGLGLAIVREIVHAWGGEVSLDTAPGRGTMVIVRLPVQCGQNREH
ncbi:sensor histidine kinase [Rhodoplanes sp. SY1]|uniref:sensor histidine kinase n=1 Tax=Rhodoplanes sp. SY1 TaxID=3166646 RepID=UPI0038B66A36